MHKENYTLVHKRY